MVDNFKLIKLLVKYYLKINNINDKGEISSIIVVKKQNSNIEILQPLLLNIINGPSFINIYTKNDKRKVPLLYAVKEQNYEMIQNFLSHGDIENVIKNIFYIESLFHIKYSLYINSKNCRSETFLL
ncbi:hypothetical protein LY90DRAFT_505373 [Neocallimastix californiae]|uniref:Ankyrin n=1 Tax=Neocallimastix californiae TaxID=1754190 RepID=A0A1Y2DU51_9FUNG|nr:hypothetical protein LY90DRAFT_505373 [Neocallimastix californiae]|eukprot:ORY62798.1 hypothetical protein LY90DRAFT_505373 [Neocallimastix californiae]